MEKVDHLVIGGGIYGAAVATDIAENFPNSSVVLAEQENELFTRATSNNHGRLHWGYQYPLHPQTAIQSRKNVTEFISDYGECINSDVVSYYAIHKNSRITSDQYESFCDETNLHIERDDRRDIFGDDIVAAYRVSELTFSTLGLQNLLKERIKTSNLAIRTGTRVDSLRVMGNRLVARSIGTQDISAGHIFNCTYSGINNIHSKSALPLLPSTHEKYALFKVALPEEVRDTSATVIYGHFASIVSNNEGGTHVLAHVKHSNCDRRACVPPTRDITSEELAIRYANTLTDSKGFLPILQSSEYRGQIVETKSVFGADPTQGERRVQAFANYGGVPNYHVIFGGKVNSFYDAIAFARSVIRKSGN